jgi:hypothetical protein
MIRHYNPVKTILDGEFDIVSRSDAFEPKLELRFRPEPWYSRIPVE